MRYFTLLKILEIKLIVIGVIALFYVTSLCEHRSGLSSLGSGVDVDGDELINATEDGWGIGNFSDDDALAVLLNHVSNVKKTNIQKAMTTTGVVLTSDADAVTTVELSSGGLATVEVAETTTSPTTRRTTKPTRRPTDPPKKQATSSTPGAELTPSTTSTSTLPPTTTEEESEPIWRRLFGFRKKRSADSFAANFVPSDVATETSFGVYRCEHVHTLDVTSMWADINGTNNYQVTTSMRLIPVAFLMADLAVVVVHLVATLGHDIPLHQMYNHTLDALCIVLWTCALIGITLLHYFWVEFFEGASMIPDIPDNFYHFFVISVVHFVIKFVQLYSPFDILFRSTRRSRHPLGYVSTMQVDEDFGDRFYTTRQAPPFMSTPPSTPPSLIDIRGNHPYGETVTSDA